MHGVAGVGGAVVEGLIGDVHGVFAFFGEIRPPEDAGGLLLVIGDGIGHPGGAHGKGILLFLVEFLGIGKTHAGIGPLAFFAVSALLADAFSPRPVKRFVVVTHHLVYLGITLSRTQQYGAGVLQHGHQEGNYKALRKDVLDGAVIGGALPFPAVVLGFPVVAVALPQGYVPAAESLGPPVVASDQGR